MPKLYRLYYCLYYYLAGFWVIKFPKPIKPSLDKIFCRYYFDSMLEGFSHHNFLFADYSKYVPENKWFFTQRKFAFRSINTHQWYSLPSLTVCNINNNEINYGLNSTFIRKWANSDLEFCTWKPIYTHKTIKEKFISQTQFSNFNKISKEAVTEFN